jgi:hypothetical protein
VAHEFSVGDRIQFTAPEKSLGVANRDVAVIDSIACDGQISARLDDGRQIEFDAVTYRHFDYGYAVTSHSARAGLAMRHEWGETLIFYSAKEFARRTQTLRDK